MEKGHYPNAYLYRRVVQAKLFIDENFADNLDLENIADEAFFSKYHFLRLFKRIYGKTPYQYLTSVRIKKSMELLQHNKPVSEVCYLVGFESISSFSGLFKRFVGISPSAYLLQKQKIKSLTLKSPLRFVPNCFAENNGWKKKSNFEEVEK